MTSRPPVFTWNEELHFGPSSDPISVAEFLKEAEDLNERGSCPWLENQGPLQKLAYDNMVVWKEWEQQENKTAIQDECR